VNENRNYNEQASRLYPSFVLLTTFQIRLPFILKVEMMPRLTIHLASRLLLLAIIVPCGNAAFEVFQSIEGVKLPEYDFNCTVACVENEFCGRDLKCHAFNCEVYYTLGHPTMTGYKSETSGSLDCQEIRADREDVSFLKKQPLCRGDVPVALAWTRECGADSLYYPYPCYPEVDVAVRFNRKCTSKPSEDTGFVCFDIAPDTDYDAYFSSVPMDPSGSDQENCTAEYNDTSHYFYTGRVICPQVSLMYEWTGSETWNVTLAAAAMVSEYFEVPRSNDFPICSDGCKYTEFCGQDGVCHSYNCENVYTYGPASVAGHGDGDTRGNLTCTSTLTAEHYCHVAETELMGYIQNSTEYESPWPVALQYHCLPVLVWLPPDKCAEKRLESRYVTFNRFCEAKPNLEQNFTCFDIDPETDMESYLADYLIATTMNANCTIDNIGPPFNEFEDEEREFIGMHIYAATCTINATHGDCSHMFSSVDDLDDYERMRAVMSSSLVGQPTSAQPTSAQPTSSSFRWASSSVNVFGIAGVATLLFFF
jgi:hypothetical protein